MVVLDLSFWIICIYFYILIGCFALKEENKPIKDKTVKIKDLVFIVLSQPNTYHKQRAREFNEHFIKQLKQEDQPELYFLHKKWPSVGSWTIIPTIQSLQELFKSKPWIIFVEEETRIDLKRLVPVLNRYDYTQEYFLGKSLYDESATIIHHFMFHNDLGVFGYPDPAAGMFFSQALIKRVTSQLDKEPVPTTFSIDYKHELALLIYKDGKGVNITNIEELCTISKDSKCVTTSPVLFSKCGPSISKADLYIGVKTCQKFLKDRIPVVKNTWGKDKNIDIEYFSEIEDSTIPTINLGIANTERGHCEKTISIIRRFVKEDRFESKKWLLIADDDTIINLNRLRRLLSCYNDKEKITLGERYGYGVTSGRGYDYITGGGGMVFSQSAARLLAEKCTCPSIDSPDDMTIGMCLNRYNIPLTHSRYFHQARPEDYSKDYLSNQLPVSFHKHWNVDPYTVYQYLQTGDTPDHDEL